MLMPRKVLGAHAEKLVISRAFGSKSVHFWNQGFPSESLKMCPGISKPGEGSQAILVLGLYIVHHSISQATSFPLFFFIYN
jgi:hypothetical protein